MLTFNVYDRVFFIKGCNGDYATAFTIDVDSRQYLIGAKHVLGEDGQISSIALFHNGLWEDISVNFIGTAQGEIDITVLAPHVRLSDDMYLGTDSGLILGQDVYFTGFPYKNYMDGGAAMRGHPLPFVKKGILSALKRDDGVIKYYIDAINNEGFSGGPIIVPDKKPNEHRVVGVVSKFLIQSEPVLRKSGDLDTDMYVYYNTGFLVGYSISHALDIISKNPCGLLLESSKNS